MSKVASEKYPPGRFTGDEKISLFIDGSNFFASTKALGYRVDFDALLNHFSGEGYLVRAYYYTAMNDTQETNQLRPLVDYLDYNGYQVVTKPTKEFTDSYGHRKIKGNMDIEIAVDMMEQAEHCDHLVLFSGDGDFRRVIEAIQRRGKRVTVISTKDSNPSMIADELRRQCDAYIDLVELRPYIEMNADQGNNLRRTPAKPYGEDE